MSYELCYTSVPHGLRPGTAGFCTVGLTRGTPAALVERLEMLSGYRPLYPAASSQAASNPVSWAYWRVSTAGQTYSVLSRVCFAGLDYTDRSNKFAHHIAMTVGELPQAGPAWAMLSGGLMRSRWEGQPIEYLKGLEIPQGDMPAGICRKWAAVCGDAGWAGVLAESFLMAPAKPVYVIYPPTLDILPLIAEALALLPAAQRWQVTFNTYFTDLPAGTNCAWRCVAAGSSAADEARRSGATVIDLTTRLPAAPDTEMTRFARDGVLSSPASLIDDSQEPVTSRLLQSAGDDDDLEPLAIKPRNVAAPTMARSAAPARSATGSAAVFGADSATRLAPPPEREWTPPLPASGSAAPAKSRGLSAVAWLAIVIAVSVIPAGAVYYLVSSDTAAKVAAARAEEKLAADTAHGDAERERKVLLAKNSDLAGQLADSKNALKTQPKQPDPVVAIPTAVPKADGLFTQAQVTEQVESAQSKFDGERQDLKRQITDLQTKSRTDGVKLHSIVRKTRVSSSQSADMGGAPNYCFPLRQLNLAPSAAADLLVAPIGEFTAPLKLTLVVRDDSKGSCRFDPVSLTISRIKPGDGTAVLVGQFEIKGNQVWIHLLPREDKDDIALLAFLEAQRLLIVDGAGREQSIQFLMPTETAYHMGQSAGQPLPGADQVVGESTDNVSWTWDVARRSGECQWGPQSLSVPFVLKDESLNSDFSKVAARLRNDKAGAEKSRDAWLKEKGLTRAKLGADGASADPKIPADVKSDYEKRQKEVDDAAERLAAIKKFPPSTVFVLSKNGVVLYKVKVDAQAGDS